jgi:hypothetical protein
MSSPPHGLSGRSTPLLSFRAAVTLRLGGPENYANPKR